MFAALQGRFPWDPRNLPQDLPLLIKHIKFNQKRVCNVIDIPLLIILVPPQVEPVMRSVIGYESKSVTLQYKIKNAVPSVTVKGLRWFYSPNTTDFSDPFIIELTNLQSRTTHSQLNSSFSYDGTLFTLQVINIKQGHIEGNETDLGYYFLQATNIAGTSTAFINLIIFGMRLQLYVHANV